MKKTRRKRWPWLVGGALLMLGTSEYRLEDLPRPDDDRVVLRERPGDLVAALRFSGRLGADHVDAKRSELLVALAQAGDRAEGGVGTAVYDPPTTVLPWLRRNEVYARAAKH